MIKTFSNLLLENELNYILTRCESFVKNNQTIPDGVNWFYNSMHLYDDTNLNEFRNRVLDVVGNEYNIQHNGIFINKIIPETNTNDGYHRDESDLTIVTYLNDDFIGGEFEYVVNNELKIINPRTNLSIIMDKKILHRVLPITEGVRYSLVTWFRLINKNII
jgi:hypothetical protein